MTIELKCGQCGKGYQLKDSMAGKRVKCKCGSAMTVPTAEVIDDDPLGLGNSGMPGPLDDLLGAELPEGSASTLSAKTPSAVPTTTATPAKKKVKKEKKDEGMSTTMTSLLVAGFIVSVFAFVGIGLFLANALEKIGFESPETAFTAHQEALHNKQWVEHVQTYTPETQRKMAFAVTWMAVEKMAHLEAIKQVLEEHGLTSMLAAESPSDRDAAQQAFAVADVVKCYDDMVRAIDQASEDNIVNPLLRTFHRKAKTERVRERAGGTLRDVAVKGDTATATIVLTLEDGDEVEDPVTFRQMDGRWFIELDNSELRGHYFLGMRPLF